MDKAKFQEITDRMEISDTVIQYATGIDMRDWGTYRTCFTDDLEVDFQSWNDALPQSLKADEWVEMVRQVLSGFSATQHISTNHVITIEGDNATCVSYMQAQHYLPNDECENFCTLGGYYTNRLVRRPEGWKIKKCKLTVTWQTGDPRVFDLARQRFENSED